MLAFPAPSCQAGSPQGNELKPVARTLPQLRLGAVVGDDRFKQQSRGSHSLGPAQTAKQQDAAAPHRGASAPLSPLGRGGVCAPAETQAGPTHGNASLAQLSLAARPTGLRPPDTSSSSHSPSPLQKSRPGTSQLVRLLKLIINLAEHPSGGRCQMQPHIYQDPGSHLPPIPETNSPVCTLCLKAFKRC